MDIHMKTKRIPQYVHLDVGEFNLIVVWKKISTSYKLQTWLIKQELDQDEIYEDTWPFKEVEGLPYV